MMGGLICAIEFIILQAVHHILSKDLSGGDTLPQQCYKQKEPIKFPFPMEPLEAARYHDSHLFDGSSAWLFQTCGRGDNITTC